MTPAAAGCLVLLVLACRPASPQPEPPAKVEPPTEPQPEPTTEPQPEPTTNAEQSPATPPWEFDGHRHLLVVDWAKSQRAALHQALVQPDVGLLVLAQQGDRFEFLAGCRVAGGYRYHGCPRTIYRIPLEGPDELAANLPEFARGPEQRLVFELYPDGALIAESWNPAAPTFDGDCSGATHVIDTIQFGSGALAAGTYTEPYGPAVIDDELLRFGDTHRCIAADEQREQLRGCDQPWAVLLVALGPDLPLDGCPGETGYDGILCSGPGRTDYCGLVPEDLRCTQKRGDEPRLRALFDQ